MRRRLTVLVIVGLLLAASTAWASTAAATKQPQRHRKHHKKPVPKPVMSPEPAPLPPPPPPVPMHEAAVPPKVTYERGTLTIDAKNSTLGDVLKSVEKLTGASFEISSGDTSERVVGRIGPGPARDVLATLLNGSHFNYVMLSPLNDPSALARVLLTPRGASLAQNSPGQPPPPQFQQQFQQPVQISPALQVQQQNATDENADNGDTPDENADQSQDQQEQPDPAQAGQQPAPTPPGVKTPEQLLQELRQQQQQVIQQQQNPPPGQPPAPDDNR